MYDTIVTMRLSKLLQRKKIKPHHLAKTLNIPDSSLHYHLTRGTPLRPHHALKIITMFPKEITLNELIFQQKNKRK